MADVKLTSNRAEVLAAVSAANSRALEIMGGKAESYAYDLAPKDTGRLANSITHQQIDENTEIIGTNVEYAPFVELGTRRQRAQPYLRPAAENHGPEYKAIWEGELAKIT